MAKNWTLDYEWLILSYFVYDCIFQVRSNGGDNFLGYYSIIL